MPAPAAADLPAEYTGRAFGAGAGAAWAGRCSPHHAGDGPRAFVVFNPVGHARREVLQLTVWDGDAGPELPPVHQRRWRAVLPDGTRLPLQGAGNGHYWGHDFADLLLPVAVGALGWSALVVEEGEAPEPPEAERARAVVPMDGGHGQQQNLPGAPIRLVNGQLEAAIDRRSGAVVSLRRGGREFAAGAFAAPELQAERPTGMSAWVLGDPAGPPRPLTVEEVKVTEWGPWRSAVEVRLKHGDSRVTVTYSLAAGSAVLQVAVRTRWMERGGWDVGIPRLQLSLPCAIERASGLFETPFGAVARPADGRCVPALRWAAAVAGDGSAGVQLLNDGAHGHELDGATMRIHLVRSSYEPDPLPEIGDHAWRLGVAAWSGARSEAELVRAALAFDQPLEAVSCGVHGGELPSAADGVAATHSDVVVTAVKPADDGDGVVVRLANHGGAAAPATLAAGPALPAARGTAITCDILERPTQGGGMIPAHGIATLRLRG